MSKLIFFLIVLAVGCVCSDDSRSVSSSEEENTRVVLKPNNNAATSQVNTKTTSCPHGERYMNECNWCTCVPDTKSGLCTAMGCVTWSCEKQLQRLERNEGCYGACTCNQQTRITSCEKKGCN